MKLHSDIITKTDVDNTARLVRERYGQDIWIESVETRNSRSRDHSITFYAYSLNGKRSRNRREGRAATWTAYGYLIAELFNCDPDAKIAWYDSPGDFRDKCAQFAQGRDISFIGHLDY